jgi:hypothetical protein
MMLIDYPHSKNTHNLKVVKFEIKKKIYWIEIKILRIFYHM